MSDTSFAFGQNWQLFLKDINDERVKIAESSLIDFLGLDSLRGKTFLDVGCGSGLFSLAALNLGAARIVSFDIDAKSTACCNHLRSLAGNPVSWTVLSGSILDEAFLADLGQFDIVYSWGVLHHTGNMWKAIENAARLTKVNGLFYIALYNKILTRTGNTSPIHDFWLYVKRLYNSNPFVGRFILEPLAMGSYILLVVARGENPITHIRNYKSHRGMSWRTDATDWVGGYPYEFATVEEVFKFVKSRFHQFNLTNLKVTSGRGLNWFLFKNELNVDEFT